MSKASQAIAELFTAEEREALRPPRELKPSEWAEAHRYLDVGQSNIPGPWRNDNAPYLRGLMDLADAPGVERLDTMKAGQIGVSEAARNVVLHWAHTDPDPAGLALPDKVKGRKIIAERLIPAIDSTPVVAALKTDRKWDLSAEKVRLSNGFSLSLMWSGSASSTSADPMRRVIDDEVDKFAEWAGRETNPVGRTWTRTRSYGRKRFQWNISTPSDRMGQICRLVESDTHMLLFMVPCPRCGAFQFLAFRQLRWPRLRTEAGVEKHLSELSRRQRADLAHGIVQNSDVWYVCARCEDRIEPHQRPSIVRAGLWRTEDGTIPDAEAVGEWPAGTRLGTHVSAMSCLWVPWSDVAAEFILALGDRERMFSFRTETAGEPWEEQIGKPQASTYAAKSESAELEPGVVPEWAVKLLCTIDTQQDHFYVVLRAWGPEMRSQRVWHGTAETFKALDSICFREIWPVQGRKGGLQPELVLIDSGGTRHEGETASRTMQVYRWAIRRRQRVRAIKGAGAVKKRREGLYIWPGKGFLDTDQPAPTRGKRRRKRPSLRIWFVDTHHFGDLLADMVGQGMDEEDDGDGEPSRELWLLNKENDEEYNTQLSNVQKRLVRSRQGPPQEVWEPSEAGAPNHYWDCEVYQIAAAYMARVHLLPSEEEIAEHRAAMRDQAPPPAAPQGRRPQSGGGKIRAKY